SGNKMDVTWKLRHGVKWHDGVAFSSKDLKATFDFWWLKYRDKNPTPLLSTSGWDQVDSVDTPDEFTTIVHFKSVYAAYLTLGTGPYGVLPEHLLQQVWAKTGDITHDKVTVSIPGGYSGSDTLDKVMVGTGPFMFKEWVTGDHLTLARNPHWWGGGARPYLNEIRVPSPRPTTRPRPTSCSTTPGTRCRRPGPARDFAPTRRDAACSYI